MRKFSPVSETKKGQRSWGRVLAPNLGNKTNMEKHKIFYFRASVTLKAVSLQLNGMLLMWKIQQTMQDDAIRTTRIHPTVNVHMAKFPARLPRSRLDEPRSREQSQQAHSYEHIANFTKDLEVRRDLQGRIQDFF